MNQKTACSFLLSGLVASQFAFAPSMILPSAAAASAVKASNNDASSTTFEDAGAPLIHTTIQPAVKPATPADSKPAAASKPVAQAVDADLKKQTASKTDGADSESSADESTAPATADAAPASKNDVQANKSLADAVRLEAKVQNNVLKGRVESEDRTSPFLEGSVQTIPKGTQMELTLTSALNSEMSQKGDEVMMKVSANVPGGNGVAVPGGWYAHGFVTTAQGHKNMHREGFVEVEFDKLVSPDGRTEVDFPAKFSTKDNAVTSTLKQAAFGSKCTTVGAIGGAILSVQLTGIGGAVASHGISVGIGAGVGGILGIIGALKRQGAPQSLYGDDDVKLTIVEPLMMPAFKAESLPSAKPIPILKDMKISVNKIRFLKDPYGDNQSRLLDVDMTWDNHSKNTYSPRQLLVIDDHGHQFTPYVGEDPKPLMRKISPEQSERIDVLYEVNSGKRKYWLSLRETATGAELSRTPLNDD